MPKKKLVLFAHGSRDPRWHRTFEQATNRVQKTLGESSTDLAYLQMSSPTLLEVAEKAAQDGVDHITVLPLFLSAGGHIAQDIPRLVAEIHQQLPLLRIDVLPPIGEDSRFEDLILARSLEVY